MAAPKGNQYSKGKGRPKKEIDRIAFEELCRIHCTQNEICSVLNAGKDALAAWCLREYQEDLPTVYKRFQEDGNPSLRRDQRKAATKGNATMLIWLGKQWLGQRDREEEDKKSPYQAAIDERHKIMMLEAEIANLKEQLSADKPKAE